MTGKVLIVDDEPMILSRVSSLLDEAGFFTRTCHMWPGVAQQMRAIDPDLVLLDYNMPGVNGSELCRILKRNHTGAVKIVLYSAEEESDLVRIVGECGADGYITKNTPSLQLVAAVEAALSGSAVPS